MMAMLCQYCSAYMRCQLGYDDGVCPYALKKTQYSEGCRKVEEEVNYLEKLDALERRIAELENAAKPKDADLILGYDARTERDARLGARIRDICEKMLGTDVLMIRHTNLQRWNLDIVGEGETESRHNFETLDELLEEWG